MGVAEGWGLRLGSGDDRLDGQEKKAEEGGPPVAGPSADVAEVLEPNTAADFVAGMEPEEAAGGLETTRVTALQEDPTVQGAIEGLRWPSERHAAMYARGDVRLCGGHAATPGGCGVDAGRGPAQSLWIVATVVTDVAGFFCFQGLGWGFMPWLLR